jgi:hypothetical protein
MWEPQRLTTLWASMASYRDSFTFLPYLKEVKAIESEANQEIIQAIAQP